MVYFEYFLYVIEIEIKDKIDAQEKTLFMNCCVYVLWSKWFQKK